MKEGFSIQEIENFTKKYRFQLFFSIAFVLACLFSYIFFGTGWSVFMGALGGILGVVFPGVVDKVMGSSFRFVGKQERITQMVLAIVGLVLAVFVPFIYFLMLGGMGGIAIAHHYAKGFAEGSSGGSDQKPPSSGSPPPSA